MKLRAGHYRQNMPKGIAYILIDYYDSVDSTRRRIRAVKAGCIDSQHNSILDGLGMGYKQRLTLTIEFEQHLSTAVGQNIKIFLTNIQV